MNEKQKSIVRIGLVSDTHMPERLAALPESLFTALAGVDLLLHAGDVGALWVLERLSAIAPVVAVHGNDDTAEAQRELPFQQLVTVAGRRILLWHSHYPDRAEELASRVGDDLRQKLQRSVVQAQWAGAEIVVFGHWHMPLVYRHEGVLVINPGALAPGNFVVRQLVQTVAILEVGAGGETAVSHINLANPAQPYDPNIDFDAGFKAAARPYEASILSPELAAIWPKIGGKLFGLAPAAMREVLGVVAHGVWAGERPFMTREMVETAVGASLLLSDQTKTHALALLAA
jgi:putative phosphoesterase